MRQNKHLLWIAGLTLCTSVFAEPKSASFPNAFQDSAATKAINKVKPSAQRRVKYTPVNAFTGKIIGKKVIVFFVSFIYKFYCIYRISF